MEKILEDVSFEAPDLPKEKVIKVNKKYVNDHIGDLTQKIDLKKFILQEDPKLNTYYFIVGVICKIPTS